MNIWMGTDLAADILGSVKDTPGDKVAQVIVKNANEPYYKGICSDAKRCGVEIITAEKLVHNCTYPTISLNPYIRVPDAINLDGGYLTPCTAEASMRLLRCYGFIFQGADVLLLGRSERVGEPLSHLLMRANATVTIAHSLTKSSSIWRLAQNADLIISSVGRADFTELEKVVEQNKAAYDKGFAGNVTDTDQNKYTVDSWQNFENAYKAGTDLLAQYPEKGRNNVAGFTVGPDSAEKTTQTQIDETATQLKNSGLVVAADASAYESARSISATIDRTAFPDGGTAITNTVTNGNGTIYKAYNGKDYVNVPAAQQITVDGFTADLLSNMNVGESSESGRIFTVACSVNGNAFETREGKTVYHYGTIAHLDFSAYKSQDTVCVVHTKTGDTKINLAKCNYQLSLLVQRDTTITVTTATRPNVIVADYFGTILGAFEGATSVTVKGNTVTVGDTVITAKDSPKYTFTGWTWSEGTHQVPAGQVAQIVQKGTPTGVDVNYTVSNSGTAANALINGATRYTAPGINKPLELTSDNAVVYWTRTVNGVETLASYEQNVTLFSANTDTTYTAYASLNDLPKNLQEQAESGTPALNGVGFFADKKFTMSCDYSAGADVTVLEVGVIYSTTKNGKDTLVKGGDGATTVVSRNVANWTGSPNSGTFTMTKKGSDTGSHYMRMYVSYRTSRMNTQVPFVVYGDIYQCVNGAVTAVN